jgi:hypothetical protein
VLTEGEQAVIAEYAYIKEQLAGPQFAPPAPQITRVEATDGRVRIFGRHLRGVRTINVAGKRVPSARIQVTDGVEPHIDAELPDGPVAGAVTITLLTAGGIATDHFRREDSADSERTTPSLTLENSPGDEGTSDED